MFWDSSALVGVLLPESRSSELEALLLRDRSPTVWWATPLECEAAIHRSQRNGRISSEFLGDALRHLLALLDDVDVIPATTPLRRQASRVLANHPLRAADALQLAAALIWCESQPASETFVCLDQRLCVAAGREGFTLLPQ